MFNYNSYKSQLAGGRPVGYLQTWPGVELGTTKNDTSEWSEQISSPVP